MNQENIYLVGAGWGFECAHKGLLTCFSNIILLEGNYRHEELYNLQGNVIVFAGYTPIVPNTIINNNTCINIHYSLLPKYRGLHSTVWAILNDENYLGLSIHLMTESIDAGEIIHQYKVENDRKSTSVDYMHHFNEYIALSLGQIISDFLNGKISLIQNPKSLATWVGRRNHDDCKVNFNCSISELRCFFRALVPPYPLPFVTYRDKEYKITKADFHCQNVNTHIARILNIDDDGIWVKAADGYLIIKEIRNDVNQICPYSNFIRGTYFNR